MLKSRALLLDTALNDIAALQTMYNVNMDLKKSPGAIPRVFFICHYSCSLHVRFIPKTLKIKKSVWEILRALIFRKFHINFRFL